MDRTKILRTMGQRTWQRWSFLRSRYHSCLRWARWRWWKPIRRKGLQRRTSWWRSFWFFEWELWLLEALVIGLFSIEKREVCRPRARLQFDQPNDNAWWHECNKRKDEENLRSLRVLYDVSKSSVHLSKMRWRQNWTKAEWERSSFPPKMSNAANLRQFATASFCVSQDCGAQTFVFP